MLLLFLIRAYGNPTMLPSMGVLSFQIPVKAAASASMKSSDMLETDSDADQVFK